MAERLSVRESVVEELTEMKRLGFAGVDKSLECANDAVKFAEYIEDWDIDPIFFGSRDISDLVDSILRSPRFYGSD